MIRHTADGERLYVIFPRDATEIRPEPLTDGGREPGTAFRGGEHAMHQAGIEGVHGLIIAQPFMAGYLIEQ